MTRTQVQEFDRRLADPQEIRDAEFVASLEFQMLKIGWQRRALNDMLVEIAKVNPGHRSMAYAEQVLGELDEALARWLHQWPVPLFGWLN